MSDFLLTEVEARRLSIGAQVLIGYYMGLGCKPCFVLFTEDTGWDKPLKVCACDYPMFRVGTIE